MFSPKEYAKRKELARTLAVIEKKQLGAPTIETVCRINFTFFILGKSRQNNERHKTKPDRSNLLKAAEDVIKGIFIKDDCIIDSGETVKMWVNSADQEGILVDIFY